MIYDKGALTIQDQISQLQDRGLTITNIGLAEKYLSHISYYRLQGYWWPLQSDKKNHIFKEGSSFEQVISIYNFDSDLRLLLFDVIEKIEISLRTQLIYHMSLEYGPWWFQDTELFRDVPALIKTLESIREQVERSKETFIKEHRKLYKNDLRFPPAWKTLELTSLGGLSRLYGNLKNNIQVKDTIAEEYGAVNHTYLPSWLQSITQIRNICAHHGRLWNKNLPGTLKLLKSPPNSWIKFVPKHHEFQYLYVHLCILKYLIDIIHPSNRFKEKLVALLERYPNIDEKALGIKDNWLIEDLWS